MAKIKRKRLLPEVEELMPALISAFRKITKEPGPSDQLQTREFRRAAEKVKELKKELDKGTFSSKALRDSHTLASYLLYFFPLHYQEIFSAMKELPKAPDRVLDLQSHTCAGAYAAIKQGATEVIATGPEERSLRVGSEMIGRMGHPLSIRKWDPLQGPLPVDPGFDLIILNHSLFQLFPPNQEGKVIIETVTAFIETLLTYLNPEGHLLITTSSLEPLNRQLFLLRDHLVEKQVPIYAPCIWQGPCPALKNNFPCFMQREMEKPYLMKELQRAADIQQNSLKATYLILNRKEDPVAKLKSSYRVVSPRLENPYEEFYILCGTNEKVKLSRRTPPEEKEPFDYFKRGDLIQLGKEAKKASADVLDFPDIHVSAACGKPPPTGEDA